jgi:hypothetical protein
VGHALRGAPYISIFIMKIRLILVLILVALLPHLANADSWFLCASALDDLRKASGDAADAANIVKLKADDLDNCKLSPQIYDLMRDQCTSKSNDYQRANKWLMIELDGVSSKVQSVNVSCGTNLSLVGTLSAKKQKSPVKDNGICDVYRGYKGALPIEELVKICSQNMSVTECYKCLSQ